MKPLAVISLPGLHKGMLGENTPHLNRLAESGFTAALKPSLPGVTCSAQTTILTGVLPRDHGIVANGWFFRDLNEVWLWRQSERLVQAESVWEAGRKRNAEFTCLKHFWWYSMASTADTYITPRPVYYADGRKGPDVYSYPSHLGTELQQKFGTFPLFQFWGPGAGLASSQWIANTAAYLWKQTRPTLSLIYLPHLDYHQQRVGPSHADIPNEVRSIDNVAGVFIEDLQSQGCQVAVVSEYDIQDVDTPVHINRILREHGWLQVTRNVTGERIDFGASKAFAVADHQIAHIYVQDPTLVKEVRQALQSSPGIETIYGEDEKPGIGLDHERSGELVALAADRHWFTYYYWMDDKEAPDFATSVDIHNKPGYDPCELLLDPKIPLPKLKIAMTLARKMMGFRYRMNVIPLDASLIRGSHGRPPLSPDSGPVLLSGTNVGKQSEFEFQDLKNWMLQTIFED